MPHSLFASADQQDLSEVLDLIGDAVCVSDKNMTFLGANRRFANFYGLGSAKDVIGKNAFDVYPNFEKSVFYQACKHTVETGETASRVGYSANLNTWIVMRCCKIGENRYAMIVHPIADSAAQSGGVGALVDELTSLPNRMSLDLDLAAVGAWSSQPAVALLDISHFKQFNETLGYKQGDRCLMEVAARLLQSLDTSDRAYRLGNDRFLLLGANGLEAMRETTKRAMTRLRDGVKIGDDEYALRFHVGLAHNEAGDNPETLLQKVEQAVARAKQRKTGWEEYRPNQDSVYDVNAMKDLQKAIENADMVLYLQPQLDMIDGAVIGAEALVRWNHEGGLRGPGAFLALVEEAGLAAELDQVVLRLGFAVLADWKERQLPLQLSLNISARSVGDVHFLALVEDLLKTTGVHPSSLCIEITEGALIHDIEVSQQVIEGLKNLGVEVALDDFGTGYCSMAYLLRYPSNYLKIDRSFVQDIDLSEIKQITVKNMIALAHGLGIGVVAEGVETLGEIDVLRAMGCDITQGYIHSPPVALTEFYRWMDGRSLATFGSAIR